MSSESAFLKLRSAPFSHSILHIVPEFRAQLFSAQQAAEGQMQANCHPQKMMGCISQRVFLPLLAETYDLGSVRSYVHLVSPGTLLQGL